MREEISVASSNLRKQDCAPVLLLIFNRPHLTERVFNVLRKTRPSNLYVAADGPRSGVKDDAKLCAETREIVSKVDWDCDVRLLYRNENLGCKRAVSSAISWFFEDVNAGIILEDDCLPHHSFFEYCTTLLDHFEDDLAVWHISGSGFLPINRFLYSSYYFSKYAHVWGWATWRRAWKSYDLITFDEINFALTRIKSKNGRSFWRKIYQLISDEQIDTWDYQWALTCLANEGLCVMPRTNLVANIGFGPSATHTKDQSVKQLRPEGIKFPLRHPKNRNVNHVFDFFVEKRFFN